MTSPDGLVNVWRVRAVAMRHLGELGPADVHEVLADELESVLTSESAARLRTAIEALDLLREAVSSTWASAHDSTCEGCLADEACDLGDWLNRVDALLASAPSADITLDPVLVGDDLPSVGDEVLLRGHTRCTVRGVDPVGREVDLGDQGWWDVADVHPLPDTEGEP